MTQVRRAPTSPSVSWALFYFRSSCSSSSVEGEKEVFLGDIAGFHSRARSTTTGMSEIEF